MAEDPRRTMLAGTDMREQRTSMDTGTGEKRMAQGRTAHVGRGNFFDFYEDIGVSTTAEGAKAYREQDKKIKENFATREKGIGQVEGLIAQDETTWAAGNKELQAAEKKMPKSVADAMDKAYAETAKTFIPVRVTDPSGKKVEATYMLPKDVAVSISAKTGGASAWINQNGKTFLNVLPKSGGVTYGQELHDALRGATVQVKNKFYESNMGTIKKSYDESAKNLATSRKNLGDLRTSIDLNKGELTTAKGLLRGDKDIYKQSKKDMLDDYQKKISTISSIYSRFKVKKGGTDGGANG